jgi:hypothetical protein
MVSRRRMAVPDIFGINHDSKEMEKVLEHQFSSKSSLVISEHV